MTSNEQQWIQVTESAKRMPGDLQWMAYIALVLGLILLIIAVRKSLKYFKLDESEKHYTGWGFWFYFIAFSFLSVWYFCQSFSNMAATMIN